MAWRTVIYSIYSILIVVYLSHPSSGHRTIWRSELSAFLNLQTGGVGARTKGRAATRPCPAPTLLWPRTATSGASRGWRFPIVPELTATSPVT